MHGISGKGGLLDLGVDRVAIHARLHRHAILQLISVAAGRSHLTRGRRAQLELVRLAACLLQSAAEIHIACLVSGRVGVGQVRGDNLRATLPQGERRDVQSEHAVDRIGHYKLPSAIAA